MSPIQRSEAPLSPEARKRVIEAILFAADGPVTLEVLAECLPAEDPEAISADLTVLGEDYEAQGSSFELVRVAGGFQLCTRERWANWVARFQRGNRRVRLSRAAVETLAIVAYRQPITRSEMEEIRGVDSGAVLHTLLERNLITIKGRSKGVGRPLLYATTGEFLEYFGLDRLEDLPRLDEIESILKEREEPIDMETLAGELPAPESLADSSGEEGGGEDDPEAMRIEIETAELEGVEIEGVFGGAIPENGGQAGPHHP